MGRTEGSLGFVLRRLRDLVRTAGVPPRDDTDCQENLDSLAASNMANLGFIYPVGVVVFVMVAIWLGRVLWQGGFARRASFIAALAIPPAPSAFVR